MSKIMRVLLAALAIVATAFLMFVALYEDLNAQFRTLTSEQVGTTPQNGSVLQTDGSISTWVSPFALDLATTTNEAARIGQTFNIATWGDSLTYGIGGEIGSTGTYIPYQSQMPQYLGYRNVYNGGISGQTSDQILYRFQLDTAKHYWTNIIWSGRNDIAAYGGGTGTGWCPTTKANIASMVAYFTANGNDHYIILGITNGGNEYAAAGGTAAAAYAAIVACNADLATLYEDHFFDIRSWLVNDAMAAIGLSPTAGDLTDISRDVPPTSLRRDAANVHYNNDGNRAIALKISQLIRQLDEAEDQYLLNFQSLAAIFGTSTVPTARYFNAFESYYLGDTSQGGGRFLSASTTGRNTYGGFYTGEATTSVSTTIDNTAFGYSAMASSSNPRFPLKATGRGNSAFGSYALTGLTTGTFNTAVGNYAGAAFTTGNNNTALGVGALQLMQTGHNNVAVGRYALQNSISSNPSTAVGYQAGFSITTGQVTAVGYQALRNSTTANGNSAFGETALYSNITGGNNSAFGKNALYTNNSGSNNVGFGPSTLFSNVDGDANTAIGNQALTTASTSDSNVVIGYQAAQFSDSTGGQNAVIGVQALRNNVAGFRNTALGYNALLNIEGSTNIAIGAFAGDAATAGSNNIIIGYNIEPPSGTGSNQLTLGNLIFGTGIDGAGTNVSSGNVGIGFAVPENRLHIRGTSATNATSSDTIRLNGARAAYTAGSLLGGIDFVSDDTNLTTPGLVAARIIGVAEATHTASVLDTGLAFYTLSGDGDVPTNLAERLRITASGNVGIGTTTPQRPLWVTNTGITGQIALEDSAAATNQHYWGLASSRGSFSINSMSDALASTTRLFIDPSGQVGISSTTPIATLGVQGTIAAVLTTFALNDSAVCQRGAGGFITVDIGVTSCIVSSKYLKDDITPLELPDARKRLMALDPQTFTYKEGGRTDIGLIAEAVAQIDSRYAQFAQVEETIAGHTFHPGDPKGVNWTAIQADSIEVIKDHEERIKALEESSSGGGSQSEDTLQWLAFGALAALLVAREVQARYGKRVWVHEW